MEITVNIKCDALVNAINRICDVIGNSGVPKITAENNTKSAKIDTANKEIVSKADDEETTVEVQKTEVAVNKETEVTTEIAPETARKALSDLSKAKGKEVAKNIIESFGCTKFTDIPKEKYAELMKAIKEA